MYHVAGTISAGTDPSLVRKLRVYDRENGQLLQEGFSETNGTFNLRYIGRNAEVDVVALDSDGGESFNDIIFRVIPVLDPVYVEWAPVYTAIVVSSTVTVPVTTGSAGLFLKSDGMKLYVLKGAGQANAAIYQFDLIAPWEISAGLLVVATLSFPEDACMSAMYISDDGINLFAIGTNTDIVRTYTMSTPWDLSTATDVSKTFNVSSQEASVSGIFFRPDGTHLYVVGSTADRVFDYTLSTPWDVTTATINEENLYVGRDGSPAGMSFKPDGSKVYVNGSATTKIYEYTLATPWDLSTGVYEDKYFSIYSAPSNAKGLYFSPDGEYFFVVSSANPAVMGKYRLRFEE